MNIFGAKVCILLGICIDLISTASNIQFQDAVKESILSFKKGELCNSKQWTSCKQRLNILVIAQNTLVPTQLGCDRRAFFVLEALGALNHNVFLAGLVQGSLKPTTEDVNMVDSLQISLYTKPLIKSFNITDDYSTMLRMTKPDIVIMWLWFWTMDITVPGVLLEATRRGYPTTKVVVFTDDVHYTRETLIAGQQQTKDQNQRVLKRADKIKVAELKIYSACDLIVTISESDKNDVLRMDTTGVIRANRKVMVVRYVIGDGEIADRSAPNFSDFISREQLIFVGNGNNPTNIIAMRWYVDKIAPKLQKVIPGVILLCIGKDWQKFVDNVPYATKHVSFLGYLTEEKMAEKIDAARVFVSPIVASTGINTKNVLALTKGIPLVTLSAGSRGLCKLCEGLMSPNFTNCGPAISNGSGFKNKTFPPVQDIPLLIGYDECDFIDKIAVAYQSEAIWQIYSAAGQSHAKGWFTKLAGATDIDRMLTRVQSMVPKRFEQLDLFPASLIRPKAVKRHVIRLKRLAE